MDIFTTQLVRVVPGRLKPVKVKVKSVDKDAEIKALADDEPPKEQSKEQLQQEDKKTSKQDAKLTKQQSDDEPPHQLDIYV